MSAFSEQLKIALDAAGLNQVELSKRVGITQSTISRYIAGAFPPEPSAVAAILKQVPPQFHGELIAARLLEEIPPGYEDEVAIIVRNSQVNEDAGYIAPKIAKDLRAAMDSLAEEAVRVPEVREAIIALARAIGVYTAEDEASVHSVVAELKKRKAGISTRASNK